MDGTGDKTMDTNPDQHRDSKELSAKQTKDEGKSLTLDKIEETKQNLDSEKEDVKGKLGEEVQAVDSRPSVKHYSDASESSVICIESDDSQEKHRKSSTQHGDQEADVYEGLEMNPLVSENKGESKGIVHISSAETREDEAIEKEGAAIEKEDAAREKGGAVREKGGVAIEKEGMAIEKEGEAREKGGAAREKEGVAIEKEGVAREKEGATREKEGAAREKEGATREKEGAANVKISQNVREKMSAIVHIGLQRAGERRNSNKDSNSSATQEGNNTIIISEDKHISDESENSSRQHEATTLSKNGRETITKSRGQFFDNETTSGIKKFQVEKEESEENIISEETDSSLISYLTGEEERKKESGIQHIESDKVKPNEVVDLMEDVDDNVHEIEGSKKGTEEENDASLIEYLSGGNESGKNTRALFQLKPKVNNSETSKATVEEDAKDSLASGAVEPKGNDTELTEDSERLVIDDDMSNVGDKEADWLDDSQRLVIEEEDSNTILGEKTELEATTSPERVDLTGKRESEDKGDLIDKQKGDAAKLEENDVVIVKDANVAKDSTRTVTKKRSPSGDLNSLKLHLTQTLLQLIAPSMYKAKPGKRQIKGSIMNCPLEASYIMWQAVFKKDAPIFHCVISGCKAKFSYSKLVLHLLLEHNLDFGMDNQSVAYGEKRRSGNKYCCLECEFKSPYSIIYLEHIRYHILQRPYTCTSDSCANQFKIQYNATELVDHLKRLHHGILPQQLNMSIQYTTELHAFLWKHRFSCPVCPSANAFYYFPLYVCHLSEHTHFEVGKDKLMSRNFQYKTELETYECSGCNYSTQIADAFFEHVRIHLTEGKAVYKCQECNRIFKSLINFRVHQATVHPKTFPNVQVVPDSQPQMDETYHMMHMLQAMAGSHGNQATSAATTAVVSSQEKGQQGESSDHMDKTKPVEKSQAVDDDLVTFSHCKSHDFLTSSYSQYILHLRKEHGNFSNVNFLASEGKNNTIAFKDGFYVCTGCAIKTEIREMFQEHMRCHTLTYPYQCTGCGKDYRDVLTPHSPCWDLGEGSVNFLIKPSPTMEDVMKKLGPLAPATSKTTDLVIFSKDETPSDRAKQESTSSQVILLDDDDSADDIEIIDQPGNASSNTSSSSTSQSTKRATTPVRKRSHLQANSTVHNFSALGDSSPNATSTPVHAQDVQTSHQGRVSALRGESDVLESSPASSPTLSIIAGDVAITNPDYQTKTNLNRLSGLGNTNSGIVSLNPNKNSSMEVGKQEEASTERPNLTTAETATIPDVISVSEANLDGQSPCQSKCYSYVFSDGYFQCGACDYQVSSSQEENFRYHVYMDVHVRGAFRKPCSQCGKSGFTVGQKPECPLVENVMVQLLQQRSSSSRGSNDDKTVTGLSMRHSPVIVGLTSSYDKTELVESSDTNCSGNTAQTSTPVVDSVRPQHSTVLSTSAAVSAVPKTPLPSGSVAIAQTQGIGSSKSTGTSIASGSVSIGQTQGLSSNNSTGGTSLASGSVAVAQPQGISSSHSTGGTSLVPENVAIIQQHRINRSNSTGGTSIAPGNVAIIQQHRINRSNSTGGTSIAPGNVAIIQQHGISSSNSTGGTSIASGSVAIGNQQRISSSNTTGGTSLASGNIAIGQTQESSNSTGGTSIASGNVAIIQQHGINSSNSTGGTSTVSGSVAVGQPPELSSSSALPSIQDGTPSTTSADDRGTQLLCGVVNGTLVALGSVVDGEIVHRTTDQVILAPSVPTQEERGTEIGGQPNDGKSQGNIDRSGDTISHNTKITDDDRGDSQDREIVTINTTAAEKEVTSAMNVMPSDPLESTTALNRGTEIIEVHSALDEKDKSQSVPMAIDSVDRCHHPSSLSDVSSKDRSESSKNPIAKEVTSVTQSLKGPIMMSEKAKDNLNEDMDKKNSNMVPEVHAEKEKNTEEVCVISEQEEIMDVDEVIQPEIETSDNSKDQNKIQRRELIDDDKGNEDRLEAKKDGVIQSITNENADKNMADSPEIVEEKPRSRNVSGAVETKESTNTDQNQKPEISSSAKTDVVPSEKSTSANTATDNNNDDAVVELSDENEPANEMTAGGRISGIHNTGRLVKQKTVLSCDIVNGTYKCLTCGYSSTNGQSFKQHMSKHIHKKAMSCEHVTGHQPDGMKKCPVIIGLVQLLIQKSKHKLRPQENIVHEKRFADSPPPAPPMTQPRKRRRTQSDDKGDSNYQDVVVVATKDKDEERKKKQNESESTGKTQTSFISDFQQKSSLNSESVSLKVDPKEIKTLREKNVREKHKPTTAISTDDKDESNIEMKRKRPRTEMPDENKEQSKEFVDVRPVETELKQQETQAQASVQPKEVKDRASVDHADNVEEVMKDEGEGFELDKEQDMEQKEQEPEEEEVIFQKISQKEPILKCPQAECNFSNDDSGIFTQHMETKHSNISRFRCACCKHPAQLDVASLVVHLKRQEREGHKYGCVFCGFLTSTVEIFETHLQEKHSDSQEFYCSYCETLFPTIAGLIAHLHVNVAKMYKCPYCDKSAPTRKNILLHLPRGHPGQQRRAMETTVVYCEDKERPGHSVLGPRTSSFTGRQHVTSGDRKSQTPPRSETNTSSFKRYSTSPLNPSSHSNIGNSGGGGSGTNLDRLGVQRQDSSLESSASNMECSYCKFTAFSKAQLEHHELWHEEPINSIPGKAFRCTICPCTVDEFANFKFHLQFHPGDHKLKYYKCGGCNSYKSNVEDKVEAHHKSQHADARDGSSSDDEEATYMVAKLKVAFHNGKFMCPTESCTEAYENVVELQEHSVQKHGSPLSDGHRHDFYILDNRSQHHHGNRHLVAHRGSDNSGNADSSNTDRMNRMNLGKDTNTNRGGGGARGGGSYGNKRGDMGNGQNGVEDDDGDQQPMNDKDVDDAVAMEKNHGCRGGDGNEDGEISEGIEGLVNDNHIEADDYELPDMVSKDSVRTGETEEVCQEDQQDINLFNTEEDVENNDSKSIEVREGDDNDLVIDESQFNGVVGMNNEQPSPAPIVVMPVDCTDDEQNFNTSAMNGTFNEMDSTSHPELDPDVGEDSINLDQKEEEQVSQIKSESGDFVIPIDPSWMKCTYCLYATRHKKSYIKHIETHEKFQTFTGNAFKCAYCAFMSQAKAPAMRHIRNFHPGKASKMFYVRLVVGKIMSEMEMMAEFGMPKAHSKPKAKSPAAASSGSLGSSKSSHTGGSGLDTGLRQIKKTPKDKARRHDTGVKQSDDQYLFDFEASLPQQIVFENAVHCPRCDFKSSMREEFIQHLRTHLYSNNAPIGDDTDDDIDSGLGTMELDPKNVKQEAGTGSIPSHQDPDWFMELTKEEAAFCNKVSGLGLFQCKLCMHMDQDLSVVRAHYVKSHPDDLPILCGYCRERCDEKSFRKHQQDCHAMHPVKMIKLALREQSGKKFLDVHAGELEMEEVIHDDGRMNDWTEAMRPFVSAEKSGTYRCNFCNYAQYGTSALKRHVFPIHFKQYPYECMYCQIGMTQVNQMKSHIIKMHPSLPIRIRKPLPPEPSDEDIQKVVDITSPRRVGSPAKSWNPANRCFSPSSSNRGLSPAATLRTNSPRNTRTPKSEMGSRDLLSPLQIKQEATDTDAMEDSLNQSEGYSNHSADGIKPVACRSFKKMFKCHYCKHTSKWTARDVQRHILTTHLGLKLFNCCYCDFGCYSRNRLETHVYLEHPGKQFRVANLDKRMNSVQVVQDTDDGVQILALFKPNGEPVYHLDPTKRDVLRKYTLSGKYFNTTTRASPNNKIEISSGPSDTHSQAMETEEDDEGDLGFPVFADEDVEGEEEMSSDPSKPLDTSNIPLWPKKMSGGARPEGRLTPEQMGQMMRKSIPKNIRSLANSWRCKMCGLVLLRNDRIKYHIICHHWKMRPYRCPYCSVMKYQKEPVHQHIQEAHPGSPLASVSLCEEKVEELNILMERVETSESDIANADTPKGVLKKPGAPRPHHQRSLGVKDTEDGFSSGEEEGEGQTEDSSLVDEESNGENAYECAKCPNFVGDMTSIKDHVIKVHLKKRLYLCDFCDSARNDISTMVEHIQKSHPDMPQRFTHSYGKLKQEVDKIMRPVEESKNGLISGTGNSTTTGSSTALIKCPLCSEECKNQADFDWHLAEEHPKYVKYKCGYCQVLSDSKRELKNHLVDHHADKQPDYTFVRNLPLTFRSMTNKNSAKKPVQAPCPTKVCKLCNYSCDSLAILNNHMESSHLNQSLFQCRLCSGLHKTKEDLLVHYGVLHQNDPLQYKVVPLGAEEEEEENDSQSDEGDMSHDLKHDQNKTKMGTVDLKCQYCLFEGSTALELKKHVDTNHGSEQDIMDGIENQSESILKNALAGESPPGSKLIVLRYECKHCNYQTRECVTIRRHVMTHINYKPYSCPLCNTNSIRSNTVKSHLRLFHKNNTLKPRYVKNIKMESMIHQSIDKIYASMSDRNKAVSTQPDWDQSGLDTFKSPPDVKKAKVHRQRDQVVRSNQSAASSIAGDDGDETGSEGGGQIKYSCKLCGYSYHGTSQNIRRHVMVHFNYRKFRCPYCDFTAVQSNNVTQHIQGIHENQPIKYLTVRDEEMERRLDDAIVKFGSDASPQMIQHRRKAERVSFNQGKGLSFKGEEYHSNGRKSQLGVNKPRKLNQEKIVPPRPGEFLYYKCKICNFTENSSSRKCTNIRRHVMSHLNYKRYVCPYCPFASTTTCMTKSHTVRKHEGKKAYWLDNKDPVMEKLMRANIIKVGGKPWTTYNYEDGGTPFKQKPKDAAGNEITSPTGSRPANMKSPMTPIQKVSVTASERMKVTAELAEEDRGFGNYQCKFCMKRLANSSAIKRHVAAHFYYRRYGCPYCELLFTQSTFAVNHVRAKHKGMAVYYMDNKDPKMEAKIRRAWVNISAEEESEEFNAAGIVRGAGKRKIKKPQKAFQLEQDVLKAIKLEEESSSHNFLNEAGQENMEVNLYDNVQIQEVTDPEENPFEMNDLGNVTTETAAANETTEAADSPVVAKQKAFKCCQCSYETEHKTSMIRHVMWKIGYKPYLCGLCTFTDVLYIGLKKHAVRKHKHEPFNPIITKDREKEAEVEDIMTRSTVYLPKGSGLTSGGGHSILDEMDSEETHSHWNADDLESFPALPDPVTVKIEPGLESFEYLYDNHSNQGEARFPKPRGEHKGHKTSDEPIPDDLVRRSVNKSRCEICGKISSSKGYIYNHVIRHGPPKLRCEHCSVCFYFPKEAKTHNERKHPDLALKVKRLWGTSKWDKKTQGIEPADPVDKNKKSEEAFESSADKVSNLDTAESGSFGDEEEESTSLLLGDDDDMDFDGSGNSSPRSEIRPAADLDMPVFPQPEPTTYIGDNGYNALTENESREGSPVIDIQALKNVDYEESILERTPVRIPVKDAVTGVYQCAVCTYNTKNPTHIKGHVLTHQPPHWRCDHCMKTFLMLYKLRKHSSTVHKFQPLMYTNLITRENCIGSKINYEGAVFPHRESKATSVPLVSSRETNDNQHSSSSGDDESDDDKDEKEDDSEYEEFDVVSVSSDPVHYASLRLHCPKCDFFSESEQEVLMHFFLHQTNPELNRRDKDNSCHGDGDDASNKDENITDTNTVDIVEDKGEITNPSVSLLRCVFCDYTTKVWEELSSHRLNSHPLEKPYKCCHCDYSSFLQTPIMLHCLKQHPEESVSLETKDVNVKLDVKTEDGTSCSVDFNPKTSINHFHPSIELRNFLDLPIELLHAFMVQNGLSEIHQ